MLEFSGMITNNCLQYMAKKELKCYAMISFVTALIFGISIAVMLIFKWWDDVLTWLCIFAMGILLIGSLIFWILSFIPKVVEWFTNKISKAYLPKKILISDKIIDFECEAQNYYRNLNHVKKVIDMGEWYHIEFYFPHKNIYSICQKNLITKGSIEEFEKLFEGKIVRVNSRKNKCE